MPSGKIHSSATLILNASLPLITASLGFDSTTTALVGLGSLTGLLLSPDLDVDAGNISINHVRDALGDIPAGLWQQFWMPYAMFMPHRGFFSHFPIVGTVLRLFYVFFIPALLFIVLFAIGVGVNVVTADVGEWAWLIIRFLWEVAVTLFWSNEFWAFFAGLAISDTVHAIMDAISTSAKRNSNNYGNN